MCACVRAFVRVCVCVTLCVCCVCVCVRACVRECVRAGVGGYVSPHTRCLHCPYSSCYKGVICSGIIIIFFLSLSLCD